MAKVSRSRRNWMNSLTRMAAMRRRENRRCVTSRLRRFVPASWMKTSSRLGAASWMWRPGCARIGDERALQRAAIASADMQRGAEKGTELDAGMSLAAPPRRRAPSPSTMKVKSPECAMTSATVPRADDGAEVDVDDAVAAFGLVHVVRADEDGEFARAQTMNLVPEIAPRLGIDACCRFVEQQQLRRMQHAGGEREALLPAAGQIAGQLLLAASSGRAARWRSVDRDRARRAVHRGARRNSRFSRIDRSSQKLNFWVM